MRGEQSQTQPWRGGNEKSFVPGIELCGGMPSASRATGQLLGLQQSTNSSQGPQPKVEEGRRWTSSSAWGVEELGCFWYHPRRWVWKGEPPKHARDVGGHGHCWGSCAAGSEAFTKGLITLIDTCRSAGNGSNLWSCLLHVLRQAIKTADTGSAVSPVSLRMKPPLVPFK